MKANKRAQSRRVEKAWTIDVDESAMEVIVVPASMKAVYKGIAIWPGVLILLLLGMTLGGLIDAAFATVGVALAIVAGVASSALVWHKQRGGPILTLKLSQRVARFDRSAITVPFERIVAWRISAEPNKTADNQACHLDCVVRAASGNETETIEFMSSNERNTLDMLARWLRELTQGTTGDTSTAPPPTN
jgi:hypothetical protein